eukprot:4593794-Alexandrium_andersonii.AAC.1
MRLAMRLARDNGASADRSGGLVPAGPGWGGKPPSGAGPRGEASASRSCRGTEHGGELDETVQAAAWPGTAIAR